VTATDAVAAPAAPPARRSPAVPHAVVGTLVAVVVEIMFFAGLVSAYLIARKPMPDILWPPLNQPRFPVADTAVNTAWLLLSGVACWIAVASRRRGKAVASRRLFLASLVLGLAFVVFQGVEWAQLLADGLTLRSSMAGAYFYLLVGAHALHAIAGLIVLSWASLASSRGTLTGPGASAVRIYWTFVVGLWPILYWLVYLQ
jgi:cytochrome c oxidase subunit 3